MAARMAKRSIETCANAYHYHEARENTCEQFAVVVVEFSSLACRGFGSSMSAQPSHFRKTSEYSSMINNDNDLTNWFHVAERLFSNRS